MIRQVSALGIDGDNHQSVRTMMESVSADEDCSAADEGDDPSSMLSTSVDADDDDEENVDGGNSDRGHHRSRRKRQRVDVVVAISHLITR